MVYTVPFCSHTLVPGFLGKPACGEVQGSELAPFLYSWCVCGGCGDSTGPCAAWLEVSTTTVPCPLPSSASACCSHSLLLWLGQIAKKIKATSLSFATWKCHGRDLCQTASTHPTTASEPPRQDGCGSPHHQGSVFPCSMPLVKEVVVGIETGAEDIYLPADRF